MILGTRRSIFDILGKGQFSSNTENKPFRIPIVNPCVCMCIAETAVKPRFLKAQIFSWEVQKITHMSDTASARVVPQLGLCDQE